MNAKQTQNWRHPAVKIKNALKERAIDAMAAAGFLKPPTPAERAVIQSESASYFGNRAGGGGAMKDRKQHLLEFAAKRPEKEIVKNVYYSPAGMAWIGDVLHQSYSIRKPSLVEALTRPPKKSAKSIKNAIIAESDFPYSYGDWVHTFLGTLLCAENLDSPVLVPHFLARKPYAKRDLEIAGIDYIDTQDWYFIEEAAVLRKRNPTFYWTAREVDAYQKVFAPERLPPKPGSITYLGRFDLKSEVLSRRFPSEKAAAAVERLGGVAVKQEILSPQTSLELGGQMETVIADHGSGVLNILHWRPKTVIELAFTRLWNNNNLFVAKACGVENYGLITVDTLSENEIYERLVACFDRFGIAH